MLSNAIGKKPTPGDHEPNLKETKFLLLRAVVGIKDFIQNYFHDQISLKHESIGKKSAYGDHKYKGLDPFNLGSWSYVEKFQCNKYYLHQKKFIHFFLINVLILILHFTEILT